MNSSVVSESLAKPLVRKFNMPSHPNGLPAPEDIGICMVAAFEGVVSRGKRPEVGETVRFLPEHCMMQKVHSGVVVHSEGNRVRIEGIDLKVW